MEIQIQRFWLPLHIKANMLLIEKRNAVSKLICISLAILVALLWTRGVVDPAQSQMSAAQSILSIDSVDSTRCECDLRLSDDSQKLPTFIESESPIPLEGGKEIKLDDVLYGYDVLFETRRLFTKTRWLGTVSSQDPIDAWIIQEVLMDIRPDIVIELGTYKGGGAVYYASIMQFYADEKPDARVITIDPSPDIEISDMGRKLWDQKVIQFTGLPTDPAILHKVEAIVDAEQNKNTDVVIMVIEDSIHYYDVVMDNMKHYWRFVTPGSYLLVQDTKLKRFGDAGIAPVYGQRNNPRDALDDFMVEYRDYFDVDRSKEYLYYTQHPGGWLRRTDRQYSYE